MFFSIFLQSFLQLPVYFLEATNPFEKQSRLKKEIFLEVKIRKNYLQLSSTGIEIIVKMAGLVAL